jgi:hypothetical protein
MYARFLAEAAAITGDPALDGAGAQLRLAGDRWQEVATLFDKAARDDRPAEYLAEISALLTVIATIEEGAWSDLLPAAQSGGS